MAAFLFTNGCYLDLSVYEVYVGLLAIAVYIYIYIERERER